MVKATDVKVGAKLIYSEMGSYTPVEVIDVKKDDKEIRLKLRALETGVEGQFVPAIEAGHEWEAFGVFGYEAYWGWYLQNIPPAKK